MWATTDLRTRLLATSSALELVSTPTRAQAIRLRRIVALLIVSTLTLSVFAVRRVGPFAQAAAIRGSMAGLLVLHASVALEWLAARASGSEGR